MSIRWTAAGIADEKFKNLHIDAVDEGVCGRAIVLFCYSYLWGSLVTLDLHCGSSTSGSNVEDLLSKFCFSPRRELIDSM